MENKLRCPNEIEVREETNKICNLILENKNDIEFRCNDGAVVINPDTLNFTYIGKFGSMVFNNAIKTRVNDNDTKRLINLASMILLYSMNNGGFNIITKD